MSLESFSCIKILQVKLRITINIFTLNCKCKVKVSVLTLHKLQWQILSNKNLQFTRSPTKGNTVRSIFMHNIRQWKRLSNSWRRYSITRFCCIRSRAMLRDSASGHISVGPKTMARFGMCMRLNSLYAVTLQQKTIKNMTYRLIYINIFTSYYVWLWNIVSFFEGKKLNLKTRFQENICM